jgi:hypothetical protein
MVGSTEEQMSNGNPVRITFRIDSEENWDSLVNFGPVGPSQFTYPKGGELGISVGDENLIVYMGIDDFIKLTWYDSFCVYSGKKNIDFHPLYSYNEQETDEEENLTVIWNQEKQIFEKTLIPLEFFNFNDGVLYFDSEDQIWKTDSQYSLIGSEIDSGIYNTDLVPPSFAGQSLSFAEQI